MTANEVLTAISTVGFPIVVAMYSLIRLEKTIKENTTVMTELLLTIKNEKEVR